MSTNTSLRGRDQFILRLILLLKPEASSTRVSLPAEPSAITAQLLGLLDRVVLELDQQPRVAIAPSMDDPLLAARWVLVTEGLSRG